MSISERTLIVSLAAIYATCCVDAAEKQIFSPDDATAFFSVQKDFASESKKFSDASFSDYETGKFETAAQKLFASKFFASLAEDAKDFPAELRAYLLSSPKLLEEFYSMLSPKDESPKVFSIMGDIWKSDAERFKKYPRLALAIALVYDTLPPPAWPHGQVSEKILPRKFAPPSDAFKEFADMRERGKFLLQTERLSVEELRFLVATVASPDDREWAQKSVPVNISNLDKLYSSVPYVFKRLNESKFNWSGNDYALKTIKTTGGICVDQAFYTTEVAKARGVPAFIFSGAGAGGFHAWAACMTKVGNWNFGIGRFEGARFVTGTTIDPQTWESASDHSLESMREGFRNGAKYAQSELHSSFAKEYFQRGDFAKAEAAARKSLSSDSRNAESWKIIIAAAKKSNDAKKIRSMYEAAMKSFFKYPDTDAEFRNEYISYLLESGLGEEAKKISSSIIVKTKSSRPDIAMSFARSELERDIASGDAEKLMSSYKRLLSAFKGDGAITFNGLCIPIINALIKNGKISECYGIMKITRQILKTSKDESLEASLGNVEKFLDSQKSKSDK